MAIRDDFIDTFSTCIDRLNNGENIDRILADYPDLANQLRPMLEAGLILPRARFTPIQVEQAQSAIEPAIQQAIQAEFGSGLMGGYIGGIIILLLVMVGAGLLIISNQPDPVGIPPVTPILSPMVLETISATEQAVTATIVDPTATPIPATVTASETPITPTIVTVTASHTPITPTLVVPTATITPSPTATAPPTHTPLADPLVVIQGPVTSITTENIAIYDQIISITPENPIWSVIQIGDVVRIEGIADAENIITLVQIEFINVVVVVLEDQIWRGDDCNVPPPDWAQDEAGEWLIRCTSRPANSSTAGQNSGSSNSGSGNNNSSNNRNNDNDDDDNDDGGGDDDD